MNMTPAELLKRFNKKNARLYVQDIFFGDSALAALFLASIVTHLIVWCLFIINTRGIVTVSTVLHYSVFRGVDLLGPSEKFYLLLLGGGVVIIINFFLARILYRVVRVASYIVAGIACVSQFIILLTLITFFSIN